MASWEDIDFMYYLMKRIGRPITPVSRNLIRHAFNVGNDLIIHKDKSFAIYGTSKYSNKMFIWKFAVVPELHGTGEAQKLMNEIIDIADGKEIGLLVKSTNERAIRFYKKMGFEKEIGTGYPRRRLIRMIRK